MKNPEIQFLMIDLFCGAGGTTTGAEASGVCKVIAAVNHDLLAIASHAANHQNVMHMTEDILVADIRPILKAVQHWKQIYPNARVILWASLECTNFSNAKGGLPRDADSRTLAHGLFRRNRCGKSLASGYRRRKVLQQTLFTVRLDARWKMR